MVSNAGMLKAPTVADFRAAVETFADVHERENEFTKLIKEYNAQHEAEKRREKIEESQRKQEEYDESIRKKEIAELQGLIGRLRSRVISSGGEDKSAVAQLAAAQTELFWLMFSF